MKKLLMLLASFTIGSFLLFVFVVEDYLFPATYAAVVDQAAREAIEGYSNEVLYWAAAMDSSGGNGRIGVSQTPGFEGYVGPASFLCLTMLPEAVSYITDCFGAPRVCRGGNPCPHPGIDYGTNYESGLRVVAPFGGKVIYVDNYSSWGGTVVIENDGYQVLLSHLRAFQVSVGDIIEAGQLVGWSGGGAADLYKGESTGSHLHFEIRHCQEDANGAVFCQAVNPASVLLPGQTMSCVWYGLVSDATRSKPCP